MPGVIEAKVSVPTIASLGLTSLVVALYVVATSFGLHLTGDQEKALAGLWLALQPLLQFALGYLSPHTARPDLTPADVLGAGDPDVLYEDDQAGL